MENHRNHWDELKQELLSGSKENVHPFHYFTLGTVGMDATARLRTVVLRKVIDDLEIIFFTDDRSKKIRHLKENNKASLLFYHPDLRLQLRIEGKASIIRDEETTTLYRKSLDKDALDNYNSQPGPGSGIPEEGAFTHNAATSHFCVVKIVPVKIEYLKLRSPKHLRLQFSRGEKGWESQILVP